MPLEQAIETIGRKGQERPTISRLLIPNVAEAGPSTPTPASPIPRTPLRFYGKQPEASRNGALEHVEEETRSMQSFNVPIMTITLPSPDTDAGLPNLTGEEQMLPKHKGNGKERDSN